MEWTSNICFCTGFTNSEIRTNWHQIQFPSDWMQCKALCFSLEMMHFIIFHLLSCSNILWSNQSEMTPRSTHFASILLPCVIAVSLVQTNSWKSMTIFFLTIKWKVALYILHDKGSTMMLCIVFESVFAFVASYSLLCCLSHVYGRKMDQRYFSSYASHHNVVYTRTCF